MEDLAPETRGTPGMLPVPRGAPLHTARSPRSGGSETSVVVTVGRKYGANYRRFDANASHRSRSVYLSKNRGKRNLQREIKRPFCAR
jgi:hypothetical protein